MIRRSDSAPLSGPASGVVLVLAALLLCLSNGRTVVSLAPWWALIFLLRFVRGRGTVLGLGAGLAVAVLTTLITWRGMIPLPRGPYVAVASVMGAAFFLPFVIDRFLAPRLGGFVATFVLPLAFVTTELLTALLSPYGSWGSLAYTQFDNLPLIQMVSVTGSAGVVFAMAWFAAVVNWAWENRFSWKRVGFEVTAVLAVLSLVQLLGGVRLAGRPRNPSTVRVAGITVRRGDTDKIVMGLLDPNHTPSVLKAARAAAATLHDTLFQRSEREVRAGARIIVWSEANGLVVKQDEPALITRGREFAARHKIHLFMALATATPALPRYENQLVAIDPDGQVAFRYHKAKPVPGDKEIGADRTIPKPIPSAVGKIGGAICFDMDFPQLIHRAGRGGADIVVAPSSDWLEIDPIHTRMAIFRGIENGFAVIRPTNKGLSAAADCQGRILASADFFASADPRIVALVPTRGARTFHAAVGDLFAWACMLALAGLAVLAQGFRRVL